MIKSTASASRLIYRFRFEVKTAEDELEKLFQNTTWPEKKMNTYNLRKKGSVNLKKAEDKKDFSIIEKDEHLQLARKKDLSHELCRLDDGLGYVRDDLSRQC